MCTADLHHCGYASLHCVARWLCFSLKTEGFPLLEWLDMAIIMLYKNTIPRLERLVIKSAYWSCKILGLVFRALMVAHNCLSPPFQRV